MASQTDLDDRIIRVLEVSARYVIWFIAILMVTIPNSKVSSSVIVNYALPDVKLEIRIPISAAYGSDITRVYERFAEEGIEIPFPQIGCPHAGVIRSAGKIPLSSPPRLRSGPVLRGPGGALRPRLDGCRAAWRDRGACRAGAGLL